MKNGLWYQKTIKETLDLLGSNINRGLDNTEVKKRQDLYKNSLEEEAKNSSIKMLLNQFTDTMILVLLGATVISGVIGDMADAITIMAIVIINAILGFIQEYRAERSLEEIKKLASPYAQVLRDSKRQKIPAAELVPGDIVFIEAGDKVPADLRLIESFGLEIDEAPLTGESVPVEKNAYLVLSGDVAIAEQYNMAFLGTAVTRGRAMAVVVHTGIDTEMGQIARLINTTQPSMTPLQIRLDQLGKTLIIICLVVCAVVTILGIYRGEPVLTMFMAGISLAVAAIPEGLPAIVTVVLALGVQRMAKRNAIIRKLPAVETLGCTTVICSDKTGTLTQNKMTVVKLSTLDHVIDIETEAGEHKGCFLRENKEINPLKIADVKMLLDIAFNCNNAVSARNKEGMELQGDPTEAALLIMAGKAGYKERLKRVREIPFDSDRKRMSVVVQKDGEYLLLVKGALDVLIKSCTHVLKENVGLKLTDKEQESFFVLQEKWADEALRVLGFAYKKLTSPKALNLSDEELEKDLILVGVCGMIDPPRKGVEKSVAQCLDAGITPVMITGDHPTTARSIAAQIGISTSGKVITGSMIEKLSDNQLYDTALADRVFARVSPQHKNRIVSVLKKRKEVVAMTGDGVNDAPAVKAADIGIAMGITGTEVTKEASSMVLADDDFSTIVRAVYEGRAIYDNIRKFIRYLLGCNIGEVLVMFLASLMGMPLPLIPIQILWVNLVTDGLPAMALGLEPPEPDIMNRKPRPKTEGIFARRLGWIILGRGLYIGIITLVIFVLGILYCRLNGIEVLELPRTMALTTLVFAQLFYVFECRSEHFSPFELGFYTNRFLIGAVICSVTMQLCVIYLPVFQSIFKTVPLELWQWVVILILTGAKFIGRYIMYTFKRLFA